MTNTEEQLLEELAEHPGVIRTYFEGMVPSLLGFLIQLLGAVLVLFVGSRLIKVILHILEKSLKKSRAETGVVTFLCSLVKYALYFILFMTWFFRREWSAGPALSLPHPKTSARFLLYFPINYIYRAK